MKNIRQRTIRFKAPLTDEMRQGIEKGLQHMALLENFEFSGNQLSFSYPFPEMNLGEILGHLKASNPGWKISNPFYYQLLAFMEKNERDYSVYQPGWQRYIEDIFIHYFDLRHGDKRNIRDVTWRKYKKNISLDDQPKS